MPACFTSAFCDLAFVICSAKWRLLSGALSTVMILPIVSSICAWFASIMILSSLNLVSCVPSRPSTASRHSLVDGAGLVMSLTSLATFFFITSFELEDAEAAESRARVRVRPRAYVDALRARCTTEEE